MRLLSVVAIVLFAFGCRTTKSHSPQSAVNSKSPAVESPSNPDVVEKKYPLSIVFKCASVEVVEYARPIEAK